jgi:hypothetical protein
MIARSQSTQHPLFHALLITALLAAPAAVVWNPPLSAAFAAGALTCTLGLELSRSPQHFFLAALGLLLTGYAFLGKGFAYLPHKPIFVGDLVLALGILATFLGGKTRLALRSPIVWLLLAFAADGAARTVPYIRVYGLYALRDAVIWGYGAFAILVAAFVLQVGCFRSVVGRYRRWFPWLLCWLPAGWLLMILAGNSLPVISRVPYATMPDLKAGDIAVQLAGIGSFLALGLDNQPAGRRKGVTQAVLWVVWIAAAVLVASKNRGGLLAMLLPLAFVFFMRPFRGWAKPVAAAVAIAAVMLALNVSIKRGGGRRISVDQLGENLASIVGDAPATSGLMGTRQWRLEWWKKIIDYTVFGKYFWTGKGFGINLADADGFQVDPNHSLRSPHDASATILARMGVPGFALWLLLQGTFGLCLLSVCLRARARGDDWWFRVDLWILAFWLAFLVNGSFDVFLEGPQGGIWFWSLFGFGIAALELQRRRGAPTAISTRKRNAARSPAPQPLSAAWR